METHWFVCPNHLRIRVSEQLGCFNSRRVNDWMSTTFWIGATKKWSTPVVPFWAGF